MKVHLENLGLLNSADFEVGELTVICGENNTGKTYATYALYGFLRSWRNILSFTRSQTLHRFHALESGGRLNLVELFRDGLSPFVDAICNEYVKALPPIFGSRPEQFEGAKVKVDLPVPRGIEQREFARELRRGPQGGILATISKAAGQPDLEVVLADAHRDLPPYALKRFIADAIAELVFAPALPNAFIASAERTGAAIFRKELDFARTRMLEALSKGDARELVQDPFRLIDSVQVDYALPVQDNVDFVRSLESIERTKGELVEQHPELLQGFEDIIGGSYKVLKESLQFVPRGGSGKRFSMMESSSAVRALLDVGFYLRHRAKRGDLLMIDEPELNLHPVNQRKLARLLVRLVNCGVKVFITTHSDYIVKEFNTLIMLNRNGEHANNVRRRYGYSDNERLSCDQVRLYMTAQKNEKVNGRRVKKNTLERANVTAEAGIEVKTFDTTIDLMNEIQSELLFGGAA